jgi:hypothetical protein
LCSISRLFTDTINNQLNLYQIFEYPILGQKCTIAKVFLGDKKSRLSHYDDGSLEIRKELKQKSAKGGNTDLKILFKQIDSSMAV